MTLDETVRAIERLETDNARLMTEMQELRGRYDMLGEGETHCPLCGTLLGAEGLEHLRKERETQGLERKSQYRENEQKVATLTPEFPTLP